MKNPINIIQAIFNTIAWFLGGIDDFMYALITFIIIDYIIGLMVAVLERRLSSEIGFRAIFNKVLIFVFVGIGNIIDVHLIKNNSEIRTAVIFFYIYSEGVRIMENAAEIGLPIPKNLKSILEQLNKEEKSNG